MVGNDTIWGADALGLLCCCGSITAWHRGPEFTYQENNRWHLSPGYIFIHFAVFGDPKDCKCEVKEEAGFEWIQNNLTTGEFEIKNTSSSAYWTQTCGLFIDRPSFALSGIGRPKGPALVSYIVAWNLLQTYTCTDSYGIQVTETEHFYLTASAFHFIP